MNARFKKGIFWSVIIASIILAISFITKLIGGAAALAFGHGPGMGNGLRQSDFGHGQMMGGFHHGPGFSWLGFLFFLIIVIVVINLAVKLLKKKPKSNSMEQFIPTSTMNTPKPPVNFSNASVLDEWERKNKN
ncbi:hypothetical protein ABER75_22150 [Niallia taxi]|uniref:Uncharacterized protein n=1 Tax=Niallia taxi TaxID=2499688 RepID=A0A437K9L4_9BACI|nr:hypothetical protein [Niallia taxi]MDK8642750.1 hypothetical protein [Niallia taxi]MED4038802.1 hypothetical protein [Niallia taxi]MED4053878.1 hypothetical protein [Niallia taxi]MED4120494.1 hypothetical protein [Niallia taxi]RVT61395.1 hypothetical protein EM808_14130 [Niallia taxi]